MTTRCLKFTHCTFMESLNRLHLSDILAKTCTTVVFSNDFIRIQALMSLCSPEELDAQMARVFSAGEPRFPRGGRQFTVRVRVHVRPFIYLTLSAERNPWSLWEKEREKRRRTLITQGRAWVDTWSEPSAIVDEEWFGVGLPPWIQHHRRLFMELSFQSEAR